MHPFKSEQVEKPQTKNSFKSKETGSSSSDQTKSIDRKPLARQAVSAPVGGAASPSSTPTNLTASSAVDLELNNVGSASSKHWWRSSGRHRFSITNLMERFSSSRRSARSQTTTSAVPVALNRISLKQRDGGSFRLSSLTNDAVIDFSSSTNACPPSSQVRPFRLEKGRPRSASPGSDDKEGSSSEEEVDATVATTSYHMTTEEENKEECPVCFLTWVDRGPSNRLVSFSSCQHLACESCWLSYVSSLIENYQMTGMTCVACTVRLGFQEVCAALGDSEESNRLVQRYDNFLLYRALALEQDLRWCPKGGCGYAVIAANREECPMLFCERPGCLTLFCSKCRDFWHAGACKESSRAGGITNNQAGAQGTSFWSRRGRRKAGDRNKRQKKSKKAEEKKQKKRKKEVVEGETEASGAASGDSSSKSSFRSSSRKGQAESVQTGEGEVKNCPRCRSYVLKLDDGTCNHMVCIVCGCEFCWLCMNEITDMHYLSPSGCTFWGRKQWTVEKRIFWQLGTLIGAPIGIGFLAAIAVPAMVIGIPVYVARKIYESYRPKNKHKRRLAVVGGAVGAFFLSPGFAAVAVSIGVPLLLAYVYVVMPVALCRSSACGHCCGGESDDEEDNGQAAQGRMEAGPTVITGPSALTVEETTEVAVEDLDPTVLHKKVHVISTNRGASNVAMSNPCVVLDPEDAPCSSSSLRAENKKNTLRVMADIVYQASETDPESPVTLTSIHGDVNSEIIL